MTLGETFFSLTLLLLLRSNRESARAVNVGWWVGCGKVLGVHVCKERDTISHSGETLTTSPGNAG